MSHSPSFSSSNVLSLPLAMFLERAIFCATVSNSANTTYRTYFTHLSIKNIFISKFMENKNPNLWPVVRLIAAELLSSKKHVYVSYFTLQILRKFVTTWKPEEKRRKVKQFCKSCKYALLEFDHILWYYTAYHLLHKNPLWSWHIRLCFRLL